MSELLTFNKDPEVKRQYLALIIAEILKDNYDDNILYADRRVRNLDYSHLNEAEIGIPPSFSHIRKKLFEYLEFPKDSSPLKEYHKFIDKIPVGISLYPVVELFILHLLAIAYQHIEIKEKKSQVQQIIEDFSFHVGGMKNKYNGFASTQSYNNLLRRFHERVNNYKSLSRKPDNIAEFNNENPYKQLWEKNFWDKQELESFSQTALQEEAFSLADHTQEMLKNILRRDEHIIRSDAGGDDNEVKRIAAWDTRVGTNAAHALQYAISIQSSLTRINIGVVADSFKRELFNIIERVKNEKI